MELNQEEKEVKELADGLRDVSNYALISILRDRVKNNEVGLYELTSLVRDHPEYIGGKVWQKEDIRRYAEDEDIELTDKQVDECAAIIGDALDECTESDWYVIRGAVDEVL